MAINVPAEEQAARFLIQQFGSLNTKATRPAIGDDEFSWLENFVPIGNGNLRTAYDVGETLYTADGAEIIYYYAFNFGEDEYLAVFLDDGTADQVDVNTGTVTPITATANTFWDTGDFLPACAQWQSKLLVIVSSVDDNGYWLWNGESLFGAGTLSPDVTLIDVGDGYTSAPTVTAYGGTGTGATFTATVENGQVVAVDVDDPGSGYLINEQVVLAFSGGGSDSGAAATATVTTTSGGVSFVEVLEPGTGHTTASVITFSGGGGSGAEAVISGAVNGQITAVTVINPGSGYTSAPTVSASVGSGFVARAHVVNGQVTGFTVAAGGSGYDVPPTVTIVGDGQGATAEATLTAGAVTAITVANPGLGYSYAKVILTRGNNAAVAVITLMPFGVKGNTVETYQSRVWVGDVTKGLVTAPSSTSAFAAADGGAIFPATESFLRRAIIRFFQSNGFLYQIADSSINVISNVQTQGNPPTTTFNNANVDPQVGTAWPNTVQAFGRALVFANPIGVYALYGGAAEKVSDQLDRLFENANFTDGITPTACVTTIFGIRFYVLAFTTTDPYTATERNIMCVWDGQKWWVGSQTADVTILGTQEIDSIISGWGCDGTNLFPVFNAPSEDLEKIFQTKLRADPTYINVKQVNRMYLVAAANDATAPTFTLSIDTERGLGPDTPVPGNFGEFLWLTAASTPFTWLTSGGAPFLWPVPGLLISGYSDNNYGQLIGFTGKTMGADATVISLTALYDQEYSPNV
ncbi:MAG: hypothetical protein AB7J28_15400 [Hyphomonadaceae bacterium]